MAALCAYSWPGNVRELRNVIERMVVLTHGTRLTVRDLPSQFRAAGLPADRKAWIPESGKTGSPESIHEAERAMIYSALKRNDGNRTRAAEQLGISRRTMQRKLKEYRLDEPDASTSPAAS
jgi:DNA-binding NtrC family response regulator